MKTELSELVDEITAAVAGQPTHVELRKLRDKCDSRAVQRAVQDAVRGINDPEKKDEVLDRFQRLLRAIAEKAARLKEQKDQANTIGIGVGSATTAGGIVAAITIAVPVVAIIPVLGGAYCIWRGSENAKVLSIERTLYEQLQEAVEKLIPLGDRDA